MASKWNDLEYGLRAHEEEQRIKDNERRLRGGTHGSKRIQLKRGILDSRHRLGH